MVQTEDIGFEKIVCNVVANPNIRYIIVGGPEPEGHLYKAMESHESG